MYIMHSLSESNCAGMYSVHGRVMVVNMYEIQHSSSRASCTLSMQDSRVKRGRKHVCQLKAFRIQSVEATTTARVPSQPGPEKSVCSLCHPRASLGSALGSKVARQSPTWRSVSIHKISYCLLLLLCSCSCSLLSRSVHPEKCLKLVHRSLVSLSLCIRLDVHDQH